MPSRLGVIVNPIAGLGGTVALNGTDAVAAEAMRRGAVRQSGTRAARALAVVARGLPGIEVLTCGGDMGEEAVRTAGLVPTILDRAADTPSTALDTRRAARTLVAASIDLLLFAGGDGTACDLLDAIGEAVPMLGIPAGVKMHSAIFATTPAAAGELACLYLAGGPGATLLRQAEVMDLDEGARRRGELCGHLHGAAPSPYSRRLAQNPKAGRGSDEPQAVEALAAAVAATLEPGMLYLLGPGTTVMALKRMLMMRGSLLGVDAILDGRQVGQNLTERDLLSLLDCGQAARLIVSPIGGQGFLFGRGNQQLSASVLRRIGRDNLILLSTVAKLAALGGAGLLVDTGDEALDAELSGWHRVVIGPSHTTVCRIAA